MTSFHLGVMTAGRRAAPVGGPYAPARRRSGTDRAASPGRRAARPLDAGRTCHPGGMRGAGWALAGLRQHAAGPARPGRAAGEVRTVRRSAPSTGGLSRPARAAARSPSHGGRAGGTPPLPRREGRG